MKDNFKVGDWVKFTNDDGSFIFKIGEIDINSVTPDNVLSIDLIGISYIKDACVKLTPKQIKILGLKE